MISFLVNFMQLIDSRRASIAGVAAIVTLLAVVNVYYFHRSQTPTFWDDSSYLKGSLDLYDALTDKGVPGLAKAFANLYGNKAPLICIFPIPVYLTFGREFDPRCLVGIGFLILMSVYLFRLGECLWSPREGLLAVAIVQTMPLFYGLTRQFLVDYGLAVVVVMWMYYLLCSHNFSTATIIRLGILLGIGILMKVTFPMYIGPPTIVATWMSLRADRDWRSAVRILGALGCVFLIGGVIASSWYIPNFKTVVGFAASGGFGKLAADYGSTDVFSWRVITDYLIVITIAALSCYYAVLLVALFPAWAASKWRKDTTGTRHALALLVWVVVPLSVTTFAVNKDARYTAPFLPAVALFLACMINAVFGRWRGYPAVAALLMMVPALAYASASLPAMERFGDFRLGRWVFWSPHLAWYASIPSSDGAWDQQEIGGELCRDARQAPLGARLFIPLAHQYLNNVNLAYLTARLKCNVQVIGLPPQLQTPKEVADFIGAVKPVYVVVVPNVPEPQLAPKFANIMKAEAERMVSQPDSGFHILLRRSLGATGKELLIYKRN